MKYQLGLYEKAMPDQPWYDNLKLAKDAGYDFVELSIDASEKRIARVFSSSDERRALRELSYDIGIPFGTLNASALTKFSLGNEDQYLCNRGMDIAIRSISLAKELGIRVVMIPGYDVYYGVSTESTCKRFLRNVEQLTEFASAEGVQLGFETMENEFMNTVEKAMRIVNRINSNYLQVYPDIGNMTNAAEQYGCDVLADLRLGRGHLVGLHLKETSRGHFREVPYGQGHVNFKSAIKAAWELGIRRYVTEFWFKEGGEKPSEVCSHFRKLFSELEKARVSETDH